MHLHFMQRDEKKNDLSTFYVAEFIRAEEVCETFLFNIIIYLWNVECNCSLETEIIEWGIFSWFCKNMLRKKKPDKKDQTSSWCHFP